MTFVKFRSSGQELCIAPLLASNESQVFLPSRPYRTLQQEPAAGNSSPPLVYRVLNFSEANHLHHHMSLGPTASPAHHLRVDSTTSTSNTPLY